MSNIRNGLISKVLSHTIHKGPKALRYLTGQGIVPEHFIMDNKDRTAANVYKLILEYQQTGYSWDADSIIEYFEDGGEDAIVSYVRLITNAEAIPVPHFKQAVTQLIKEYQKMHSAIAINGLAEDLDKFNNDQITSEEFDRAFTVAKRRFGKGFTGTVNRDARPAHEDYDLIRKERQRKFEYYRKHGEPETLVGYTGLEGLDAPEAMDGIHRGKLLTIGGPPGSGKTTLALQMLNNVAGNPFVNDPEDMKWNDFEDLPFVVFLSFELPREVIYNRLTAMHSGVPVKRILSMRLTDEEYERVQAFSDYSIPPNLIIIDDRSIKPEDIYDTLQEKKREYNIEMGALDYAQLPAQGADDLVSAIGEVSKAMADASKTLDMATILLSQLTRPQQSKPGTWIPTMHNLKGSGGLGQDADIVGIIYPILLADGTAEGTYKFYSAKARNSERFNLSMQMSSGGLLVENPVADGDGLDFNTLRGYE